MLPLHTILHPTDFSPRSEYAFQMACALARDYNARLVVLYVQEPPAVIYTEMGAAIPNVMEPAEAVRERLAEIRPPDQTVTCEHLYREGHPATEILQVAKEVHCELIVMGTHGRRGLTRLLMGSVAEEVMRKAPCPVLTAKAPLPELAEMFAHPEMAHL